MTFRPWSIYIASVFILIGCVSGIQPHDSDLKLRKLVGHAAKRASNAHNQLATAHGSKANFFQNLGRAIQPSLDQNYTLRYQAHLCQTAHMGAMHLHGGRATEHASHRRDVVTGKHTRDDLIALKEQFESSERHATAGLTRLKASNAYKEAFEHARHVGDRAGTQRLFQNMILQSRLSLNHTPANAANFNPEHAISDAISAEQNANLESRHFMQQT